MTEVAHPHRGRVWYLRPPVWILAAVLAAIAVFVVVEMPSKAPAISYGDFFDQLEAGNVAGVTFTGTQIDGSFKKAVEPAAGGTKPQTTFTSELPDFGDPALLPALRKERVVIDVASSSTWTSWLGKLPWPMLLILGVLLFAGLSSLGRRDKSAAGSTTKNPLMGAFAGLFGRHDQAGRQTAPGSSAAPPNA